MAARNPLEDVLLQMQNLKLSSPLRTDQSRDENKENILEGQDARKSKTEGKDLDGPIIKQTAEKQPDCQEIKNIDPVFSEIPTPPCTVPNTSPPEVDPESFILDSESLVNENNAIVESDVNNFESHEPGLLLSNCEQKTSTQSLYDDCIDVIGKSEGQGNCSNSVSKNVSVNLDSTYIAEEQFESFQEIDELPLNQTHCVSEPNILNNTQVIEEANETVFDDAILDTFHCEEKLESDENLDIVNERCDHTFIEHSREENQKLNVESIELPESKENLNVSVTKTSISSDSTEGDTSLLNITRVNRFVEDLEKSTAALVSDSSNRSLNASLNSTQFSESINNTSDCQTGINEKTNIPISIESTEVVDVSSSDNTNQVENNLSGSEQTGGETVLKVSPSILTSLEETSGEVDLAKELTKSPDENLNINLDERNFSNLGSKDIEQSPLDVEDASSTLAVETLNKEEIEEDIKKAPCISRQEMEEINEKLQQEFSDTKLELNATQQAKALLEFEISKKDEIILKTEAESMKKEQQYVQEIKALKEQLKEKENKDNTVNERDSKESLKELEEALKEAKAKESDLIKVLDEYEKTIATRFADYNKLKEENATLNRHLSNLELSFSDVHQKYEKAKQVIFGYKKNEEKLREGFAKYDETFIVQEGRYESLKAHAQSQIDKCNVEISQYKDKCESEITKLKALVKRLEIKHVALETSLEQKTKECMALAALCDEVTGNKKY